MKRHNQRDKPYPTCGMGEPDCFALDLKGRCTVLENTDFRCSRCPFYKTVDQFVAERISPFQHLRDIGRDDLIMKYYHMNTQNTGRKKGGKTDV